MKIEDFEKKLKDEVSPHIKIETIYENEQKGKRVVPTDVVVEDIKRVSYYKPGYKQYVLGACPADEIFEEQRGEIKDKYGTVMPNIDMVIGRSKAKIEQFEKELKNNEETNKYYKI